MTYRPESYAEMVQDAARSVSAAIADGITRMEVEFPPVPVNVDGKYDGLLQRLNVRAVGEPADAHA